LVGEFGVVTMTNEIEAALAPAIPRAERLRDLLGSALNPHSTPAILAEVRALLAQIGEAVELAATTLA
jgi:hypothetical protein